MVILRRIRGDKEGRVGSLRTQEGRWEEKPGEGKWVGFRRKVASTGSWGKKIGREEQGKRWKDGRLKKKGGKGWES